MKKDKMEPVAKKTANKSLRMDKKESMKREGAENEKMDKKEGMMGKGDKTMSKYRKMYK